MEELTATSTPIDSTADAVILYHTSYVNFSINSQYQFVVEEEFKIRIKVLTDEGKDAANRSVMYYYGSGTGDRQYVRSISATAYNLVDGKIAKTDMDSKYVFDEKVNEKLHRVKFSVPEVKAGTVFECKYVVRSQMADVPNWEAQRDLPVVKAECTIDVPEYFKFKYMVRGYEHLDAKVEPTNISMTLPDGVDLSAGTRYVFKAENLPAIKEEPYMNNPSVYATRVDFELASFSIPGHIYKDFTTSDASVRQYFLDNLDFKKNMGCKNPLAQEMASLNLDGKTALEKATAIYMLVKSKVKWNEGITRLSESPAGCVKAGKGSNADINFVLISMLRSAGVPCTALLVKLRSDGPLLSRATIDEFSTFVVAFQDEQGGVYFLDGASDYGAVNAIYEPLLGEGMLLETDVFQNGQTYYNLYNIGGNTCKIMQQAVILPDGTVQGARNAVYAGMKALEFKTDYNDEDSVKYVSDLEKKCDMTIKSFKVYNASVPGNSCRTNIKFVKSLSTSGDFIYFNPLIVPDETENVFKSETRLFPVEIPFLQYLEISSRVIIPDGYEVEEMPKNDTISMPDGKIAAVISFEVQGNMIIATYGSQLNTTIIPPADYKALRDFWTKLVDMNNLTVVLKKKAA